tara:strand:- start:5256 stop:5363 length:108 start_codon:yes stop_codon:yes gene_type:complete
MLGAEEDVVFEPINDHKRWSYIVKTTILKFLECGK